MTSEPADSGGSSGGTAAVAEHFVVGGHILWRRLLVTVVGGAWLAVITGVVETIVATVKEVTGLYTAVGDFLAALVDVVLGAPTASFSASYSELEAYVGSMGLFGYVAGVASVLLITWIVAWGVNSA